jgi:glycosyltransferase involved in cell wall biosynthesis
VSTPAVVVIAQNEAPNIRACLDSVSAWASEVFVVDAFSTDNTCALAEQGGAFVVQHAFENCAVQRNWALDNLPLSGDWILFLDADERATEGFRDEATNALATAATDVAAFNVFFDFVFLGRVLHYAYESPPVIRLIRSGHARWQGTGAREYCQVDGRVGSIHPPIRHEDDKGLSAWIAKQNRNASREARLLWEVRQSPASAAVRSSERRLRIWVRERLWQRLPLFFRPIFYFLYRYLVRGGFLDGRAGLVYTFLQGYWYNFLIDAKYLELTHVPPRNAESPA